MKSVKPETGVVHLQSSRSQNLGDFLLTTDLSELGIVPNKALIDEWLYYGCIYIDGLRTRATITVNEGQVVRLHTRRKSYVSHFLKLSDHIVLDHPEFLVLNKPAGLPSHATLDNFVQNAQFILSSELEHDVYITHRLDMATQGLLIMAKTKDAQSLINKMFARSRLKKFYSAKTQIQLQPGVLEHYMAPSHRAPKIVSDEPRPKWWRCQLEVLDSVPFEDHYLSSILLITGKTHQIRAQLACVGAPIIGDTMYGSKVNFSTPEGIGLECSRLEFRFRDQDFVVSR